MANAIKQGTGSGAPPTKWAYFGKQRGASGIVRDIGWVRVGSPKWKSLVKPVGSGHYGGGTRGGAKVVGRPALHPIRYKTQQYRPGPNSTVSIKPPKKANEVAGHNAPGHNKGVINTHKPVTNPIGKQGQRNAGGGGGGGGGGGKSGGRTIRAVGSVIGTPKVGTMMKRSMANSIAGMQFDAQIHDAQQQLGDQMAQHQQNLADITNWYNQIQGMNAHTAAANAAETQQAAGASDQATQAALAAIGGGGNAAAGTVAAAGNDNAALLRALGTVQQNYQNNLTPALGQAQAEQMSAQSAIDSQAQQQMQQSLSDLLGQRGQAKTAALQQIISANNSLAQQRFANQLSKIQTQMGVSQLAGNMRVQQAQLRGQQLANKAAKQQISTSKNGFIPWAKLNANDRYNLAQQLIAGPNGKAVPLPTALQRAHALGYAPQNVAGYLRSFYA